MHILKGYVFGIGYAFLCLLLSLIIYKLGASKRVTRKLVHILVGFEWIILYHYMGAGVHFLAVCLFFLLLLSVAYWKRLMPMISSDADNAPGTVYYAVAMTGVAAVGCFVPEVMLPFGVGIYATSIGDGFAGVIGQSVKRCNPTIYRSKSLLGSLAGFFFTLISTAVMNYAFDMKLLLWQMLTVAFVSMMLELITGFGLDNITITWGITALTYGFMYFDSMSDYVLPIIMTPVIIAFSVSKKALTRGGVIAAVVLDVLISFSLGNLGFALLASFFIGGVLVDKIKKRIKKQGRTEESAKGDCRDAMQVFANGLLASILAVLYYLTDERAFIIAFAAVLAEALADTVSSGIGVVAKNTYDPWHLRLCESGLSGGMSFVGTFSSLVGAYLIAVIAYAFDAVSLSEMIIITIVGFLGGVFDSFLGSVFQVKYKCGVCGRITEKRTHCEEPAEHFLGISFIDNDAVNILSGVFAAIVGAVIYLAVF